MACACKNAKKISQPKQINKSATKSISPRKTSTNRVLRKRPF